MHQYLFVLTNFARKVWKSKIDVFWPLLINLPFLKQIIWLDWKAKHLPCVILLFITIHWFFLKFREVCHFILLCFLFVQHNIVFLCIPISFAPIIYLMPRLDLFWTKKKTVIINTSIKCFFIWSEFDGLLFFICAIQNMSYCHGLSLR